MEIANEVLVTFMDSLPVGCSFSILSFGTSFDYLKSQDITYLIDYIKPGCLQRGDYKYKAILEGKDLKFARREVRNFYADFGYSNLLPSFKHAVEN